MSGGLYLGLISGTSADGVDAALCDCSDGAVRVLAAATTPYPSPLRMQLLALAQQPEAALSPDAYGALDAAVGDAFAAAALALLRAGHADAGAVRGIGSHGQTLRHRPQAQPPFSLQVGDAARIAEATGITTVAQFRQRDIAAGGQGAPLMPAFHAAVLAQPGRDRAVLNLGGIANLTVLPAAGPVRGFDTGPGNGLMDGWAERHLGTPYDASGRFAAQGNVQPALLARLQEEPYFAAPAPKSTGREHFSAGWLQERLDGEAAADVQATLLELTARTVAAALRRELPGCGELLVCGGGVHNALLMARLQALLAPIPVRSTLAAGLDPDHVEAAGFAWLACRTLEGLPGNLPAVTGARGARILGAVHYA
jgi:anhydro-N-acetylmuramic acid kinase